jgi:hypothetical protein
MALEERIRAFTYESEAAIGQYLMVIPSTTIPRGCKIAGAGATKPLGSTLQAVTAANRAIAVAKDGIIKVKCGAAIGLGAIVTTDAAGKAVTGASGFGTAVTATSNADEIVEVQWGPVPV